MTKVVDCTKAKGKKTPMSCLFNKCIMFYISCPRKTYMFFLYSIHICVCIYIYVLFIYMYIYTWSIYITIYNYIYIKSNQSFISVASLGPSTFAVAKSHLAQQRILWAGPSCADGDFPLRKVLPEAYLKMANMGDSTFTYYVYIYIET